MALSFSPFVPSEEAVNEVKRQAMTELQKAVSDAERKAHEMISAERSKMERALAEAKRQASEDALTIINQQEDSSEVSTYHRPLRPPTFYPYALQTPSQRSPVSSITLHFVSFILWVISCKQLAALGLALDGGVMITVRAGQSCTFIKVVGGHRWLEQSTRLRPL